MSKSRGLANWKRPDYILFKKFEDFCAFCYSVCCSYSFICIKTTLTSVFSILVALGVITITTGPSSLGIIPVIAASVTLVYTGINFGISLYRESVLNKLQLQLSYAKSSQSLEKVIEKSLKTLSSEEDKQYIRDNFLRQPTNSIIAPESTKNTLLRTSFAIILGYSENIFSNIVPIVSSIFMGNVFGTVNAFLFIIDGGYKAYKYNSFMDKRIRLKSQIKKEIGEEYSLTYDETKSRFMTLQLLLNRLNDPQLRNDIPKNLHEQFKEEVSKETSIKEKTKNIAKTTIDLLNPFSYYTKYKKESRSNPDKSFFKENIIDSVLYFQLTIDYLKTYAIMICFSLTTAGLDLMYMLQDGLYFSLTAAGALIGISRENYNMKTALEYEEEKTKNIEREAGSLSKEREPDKQLDKQIEKSIMLDNSGNVKKVIWSEKIIEERSKEDESLHK